MFAEFPSNPGSLVDDVVVDFGPDFGRGLLIDRFERACAGDLPVNVGVAELREVPVVGGCEGGAGQCRDEEAGCGRVVRLPAEGDRLPFLLRVDVERREVLR